MAIKQYRFPDWAFSDETYFLACLLHDIRTTEENLKATKMSFEFYRGGGFWHWKSCRTQRVLSRRKNRLKVWLKLSYSIRICARRAKYLPWVSFFSWRQSLVFLSVLELRYFRLLDFQEDHKSFVILQITPVHMMISCTSRLLRILQAIFLVYIGLITLCVLLSKKTNPTHGLTRRHLARRNFPRWFLEIV
jgi:hypothetical protein